MPTYTYQCAKCDHLMHIFHSMTASPKVKCEACGSAKVKRLIGTGAGLIFKGSGFYETDYKKKNGSKAGTESGNGSKSKADSKTDTATASKPDSKSESKSTTAASSGTKPASSD
jgi:putative FmdB family regulatory protein